MKILKESNSNINVGDLKDGQIAVITKWSNQSQQYQGVLVQRTGNHLWGVGSIMHWDNLLVQDFLANGQYQVRVLPKGTVLEI